jgi:hypothetical protein
VPLTKSDYVSLSNGRFKETSRADMERAFEAQAASGKPLVVHFHGGLVSRDRGMELAERLKPVYEAAPGHPLFVVWQSGLLEVIAHNLRDVADERIFKRIVARVLQFALGKVRAQQSQSRGFTLELPTLAEVSRAVAAEGDPYVDEPAPTEELTELEEAQARAELEADEVLRQELEKIANTVRPPEREDVEGERGLRVTASTETLMEPEVIRELVGEGPAAGERGLISTAKLVKATISTLRRVLSRLASGRGHGVYPTVVEEVLREFYVGNVGGLLWRQMKKDSADAFGDDPETFGGTALLDAIGRMDDRRNPVLVGHSTGAVWICDLIERAAASLPPERRFDVVLLAPACDFARMARAIPPNSARIDRLRVFCMRDELECRDQLASIVYPRSLLYFVSGLLEPEADRPIVGMQRFHSGKGPFGETCIQDVDAVRKHLQHAGRSVWSVADAEGGLASGSTSHGGFDDDPPTLKSVQTFIADGARDGG